MSNSLANTLLLLLITLLVTGAGYYLTEVRQSAALQLIDDQEKAARLRHAEVEQLLVEEARTAELAEESVRKWRARYKLVPVKMETPDILQYLEGLSTRGFENIYIDLVGVTKRADFSYYTFKVGGTAFFDNLHDFVWHVENNREFYHIRNLSLRHVDVLDENPRTGVDRRLTMVDFTLELDAYFAGIEGLSAAREGLMAVPASMLPIHSPAHNSFNPLIKADLPPNDQLLVDVENDKLVSIIGNRAIFQNKTGEHTLYEGDAVYLGQITKIDPINAIVRASLNKGGIPETAEIKLEAAEPYEQARGKSTLQPIDQ